MSPAYFPKLLAPEFDTHSPQSFHDHVSKLKRIPQRSAPKKPPRLAALKGKLVAKAKIYELSSGRTMYPLNFTVTKVARKSSKHVARAEIDSAAQLLLQPVDAIIAHLEKKKFILEPAL